MKNLARTQQESAKIVDPNPSAMPTRRLEPSTSLPRPLAVSLAEEAILSWDSAADDSSIDESDRKDPKNTSQITNCRKTKETHLDQKDHQP